MSTPSIESPLEPTDWLPLSRLWRIEGRLRRKAIGALFSRARFVRLLARHRPGADPHIATVLALADLLDEGDVSTRTPTQARAELLRSLVAVDAPAPACVTRDLRLGQNRARLYEPPALRRPAPALLYLHGGGFVTGSIETHEGVCRRLACNLDAAVIALDYRLAPEHRFPAAVDDSWSAFISLAERASEFGLDPNRIAIGGDSAGGNLSAVISRRAALEHEPTRPRPVAQMLLYPALDVTLSLDSHRRLAEGWFLTAAAIAWYIDHYVPEGVDRSIADLSPLLHSVPASLAPAVIAVAGFDPLVDEGRAYADKLREAGVDVALLDFPTLIHGFAVMGHAVPAALEAMAEVTAAMRRHLHP